MKRPLLAVSLCLVALVAGFLWIHPPSLSSYEEWDGREVYVSGRVERKEYRTSFGKKQLIYYLSDISILPAEDGNVGQENSKFERQIQLICYAENAEEEPQTGSRVIVHGTLSAFQEATNPGQFDSRMYYAAMNIGLRIKKASVLWESGSYSNFEETLWRMRKRAAEKLERLLPETEAAVMKTMLLGDKSTLDSEQRLLYQQSGIAHVLAISGLHISIVGMGIYQMLRKAGLPICPAAVLGILLILGYGVFAGAGVSACRAAGMFVIRMLAEILGRTYDMPTAVGVVMALMVFKQPLYLFHSGFLLSFASVLGIGLLYPALERGRREKLRCRQGMRKRLYLARRQFQKSLLAGISVTAATLPVTMWYFYEIPVYSVFLNLLVLPLMSLLMYGGIGLVCIPEGVWSRVLVLPVWGILQFYEMLCFGSKSLPGNLWIAGRPARWQILLFGACMAVIITLQRRLPRKVRMGVFTGAVLLLSMRMPGNLQITFLDVGQGDSICIQAQNGRTYLVDGGSSSDSAVGENVIVPFLKCRGIRRIDALIITHPDQDHCNGLEELLENGYRGRIARLILPDIAERCREEDFSELEQLAREYDIPVYYLASGMAWQEGEITFYCLHPPAGYDSGDSNAYSQVIYMKQGEFSVLFTGDVEGDGENLLTGQLQQLGIGEVTVLKVAHHGSRNSTTEELLTQIRPQAAVISCGKNNRYGHPHEELLERLEEAECEVLRTDELGAIEIKVKGEYVTVAGYDK